MVHHRIAVFPNDIALPVQLKQQVPRSLRRNALPVERINRSLLMGPEHVACALVELQQIGKTASGADGVLHDPPEAFDGVEVVPTMSW